MPNMAILAPSSPKMLEEMLRYAVFEHNGPIAIRYPKEAFDYPSSEFEFGKAEVVMQGSDVTLVSVGNMMEIAMDALEQVKDISVELIDLRTVKPFDIETIQASADKTKKCWCLRIMYKRRCRQLN